MGIMHREIIKKRRDITIVYSIIFLSLMIGIARLIGEIRFYNIKIEIVTDPIFILLGAMIIFYEMRKCETCYKYSVIADQLIIHKIKSSEHQETLENLKLNDIVFFGEEKDNSNKYKAKREKKYICDYINNNKTYCCVYKKDKEYRKFYFQPSGEMVEKLKKVI